MSELLSNPVVLVPVIAWLAAEALKFGVRQATGSDAKLGDTGGMPSGHAAFVTAVATIIGLREGLESPLFGLAAVLVAIVIHDAIRLRWSVGQQAERLNTLIANAKPEGVDPVIVWHGHRIREVLAGAAIGIGTAVLLNAWAY